MGLHATYEALLHIFMNNEAFECAKKIVMLLGACGMFCGTCARVYFIMCQYIDGPSIVQSSTQSLHDEGTVCSGGDDKRETVVMSGATTVQPRKRCKLKI